VLFSALKALNIEVGGRGLGGVSSTTTNVQHPIQLDDATASILRQNAHHIPVQQQKRVTLLDYSALKPMESLRGWTQEDTNTLAFALSSRVLR